MKSRPRPHQSTPLRKRRKIRSLLKNPKQRRRLRTRSRSMSKPPSSRRRRRIRSKHPLLSKTRKRMLSRMRHPLPLRRRKKSQRLIPTMRESLRLSEQITAFKTSKFLYIAITLIKAYILSMTMHSNRILTVRASTQRTGR